MPRPARRRPRKSCRRRPPAPVEPSRALAIDRAPSERPRPRPATASTAPAAADATGRAAAAPADDLPAATTATERLRRRRCTARRRAGLRLRRSPRPGAEAAHRHRAGLSGHEVPARRRRRPASPDQREGRSTTSPSSVPSRAGSSSRRRSRRSRRRSSRPGWPPERRSRARSRSRSSSCRPIEAPGCPARPIESPLHGSEMLRCGILRPGRQSRGNALDEIEKGSVTSRSEVDLAASVRPVLARP